MSLHKPKKLSLTALEGLLQLLIGFFQSKLPISELCDLRSLLGDQLIFLCQRLLPDFHLGPDSNELLLLAINCGVQLLFDGLLKLLLVRQ